LIEALPHQGKRAAASSSVLLNEYINALLDRLKKLFHLYQFILHTLLTLAIMGLVIACAIALVTIFRWFSLASPITQQKSHGNASITPRLALRDGTTTGISVTKMAAIGDSYSAGIGAGDRLGNIALQGQGTGEFFLDATTL
jgi:hypothetical protein